MGRVIRSTRWPAVLLLFLVLCVAQCGDESEIVIDEDPECFVEDFEGGSFSFIATGVSDRCTGGLLEQTFPIVGEQFGPVDLPAVADLNNVPVQIPGIPIIGTVSVRVWSDGTAIRFQGTEPIEVDLGGLIGSIAGTVSGSLCPKSTSLVEGQIVERITAGPFNTPCNVIVGVTGTN